MSTQSLRYFPTLEKNNYGQIKKQKFSKATFKERVPMLDKDCYKKCILYLLEYVYNYFINI